MIDKNNLKFNTIGIIAAMDKELDIIKQEFGFVSVTQISGMNFYEAKYMDKTIYIVKCGVGKINAAVCTEVLIVKFNVQCIINTGVAGAIDNSLNIGDIVISKSAVIHDMDVTTLGYKLGQNPDFDQVEFMADDYLIELVENCVVKSDLGIRYKIGTIATGDAFVSSKVVKERLSSSFQADCVEMEGGSIAQVCYVNKTPFVIIRSMSDKADDTGNMDYREFSEMAAKNSAKIVINLLISK